MTTTANETAAQDKGKATKATAKVASAYGKELKDYGVKNKDTGELITELTVSFEFDELDPKNPAHQAIAASEFSTEDIVKSVNAARKASALASARTKALNDIGVQAPAKDSEESIKANLRRQFRNMNLPDAVVEQMVEQTYQQALSAKQ